MMAWVDEHGSTDMTSIEVVSMAEFRIAARKGLEWMDRAEKAERIVALARAYREAWERPVSNAMSETLDAQDSARAALFTALDEQ
jgi:hypothetical protein